MRLSRKGKEILVESEGFRNRAYTDQGGLWTIGVGHLLSPNELRSKTIRINGRLVSWGQGLTRQEVYDLLDNDLVEYEDIVNTAVKVKLDQNQFDALVIFAFNIGETEFLGSTLLRLLNEGNYSEVPTQLQRWNKVTVNGVKKVSDGLINRRETEIALWKGLA